MKPNFEQLYNTEYKYVRKVAYKWFRTQEHADDATQDFFLWLFEHLNDFDGRIPFINWFRNRLNYKMYDYRYSITRRKDLLTAEGDLDVLNYPCGKSLNEVNSVINKLSLKNAMKDIHPNAKEVYRLMLDNDLQLKEVAEILGINPRSALTRLRKTKSHMLRKLS